MVRYSVAEEDEIMIALIFIGDAISVKAVVIHS